MFKSVLLAIAVALSLGLSASAWSYDEHVAQSYADMFAPVKGTMVGKHLHMLPPAKFVDKIKGKKPFIVLDVRTQAELKVMGMTIDKALNIPLSELFKKENLAKLPSDKPVIVVCQTGVVATAAGTALRHVGFDKTYILKGGLQSLIAYLDAKKANLPLKKK